MLSDATQKIRMTSSTEAEQPDVAPTLRPLGLDATLEEALAHVADPSGQVSAAYERLKEVNRRLLALVNDLQAAGVPLHEIQGACAEQAIELSHELNRRRRALIRVGAR